MAVAVVVAAVEEVMAVAAEDGTRVLTRTLTGTNQLDKSTTIEVFDHSCRLLPIVSREVVQ